MILDNNFFKREVRCGFEIDEMMKRAWAAQMEVLTVIDKICKKNGLRYFADAGTLLGAVRHQGFIPWDDGIDISMLRKDYNELIQIMPQELPRGFVIAGMYADSERLRQAAFVPQLRVIADETLWNFNAYMQYFHGFPYQRVGIDIFPIDTVPEDKELADLQKYIIRSGIILLRDWAVLEKQQLLGTRLEEYEQLCNVKIPRNDGIKNQIWKIVDAVCALYEGEQTEEVSIYQYWINTESYCLKRQWYEDIVYLPFENIEIPAPRAYDEVLTRLYGDYMIPVQGMAEHDYPFYEHMEQELKRQIANSGFDGTVEEFCEKVSKGELYI